MYLMPGARARPKKPAASSGGSGLTVGITTIAGGTTGNIEYNNAGVLGEYTVSGTGTVVALVNGATFIAPILGTPVSGTATNLTGLPLASGVVGVLPVVNGGTNASAASITAFNNITGFTASGATGSTATNLVFSGSPTLTGTTTLPDGGTWTGIGISNASAIGVATTAPTKGIYILTSSIGTTSTDAMVLANTAAAATSAAAQQWSPRLHWIGQGWKVNATAASQTVDWIAENQIFQGSANPTSSWVLSNQINGAGYGAQLTLTSAGLMTIGAGGAGISLPNGSNNATFQENSGYAILNDVTGSALRAGGSNVLLATSTGVQLAATGMSYNINADTYLSRSGAAVWQIGNANAASPVNQTMQAQGSRPGTDNNVGGATLTIQPGKGTGTGTASSIAFNAPILAAGGSVGQVQTLAMTIVGAANGQKPSVIVGSGATLSTTVTDGFLYLPTCAGTPSGTPTNQTGTVPMVFDTTNNQFWFYTGGAWKQPKTPAAAAIVTWQ